MNREFLKEQGLTDEQIESVMKEHGKTLNETKAKADRVDGLESQIEDLEGQIEERDNQLNELKEVDAEGLQQRIQELEESNESTKTEYQERLDKQAFDFSLERALVDAKVRNPKAVKALLDIESIKLDGDTLLGLDDQLKALQESDAYLFRSDGKPTPQIVAGGNPNGGGSGTLTKGDIMKEKDTTKRQRLIQENAHLFK